MQLLVFWRCCGEDGGDRHEDGGSVGVTHLVDHDGGQDHAQQLEGDTVSPVQYHVFSFSQSSVSCRG